MFYYMTQLPEAAQKEMSDYIERIEQYGFIFRDEYGYIFVKIAR